MQEKGKDSATRYASVILEGIPDMLEGFAFIHEAYQFKEYKSS